MLAVQFITTNLVFLGIINGLVIAPIAMGIVLVYRSSRVINFAVGDMGVPIAGVLAIAVGTHGVPYWIALVGVLALGAVEGAVIELGIIRRLFRAPRVIVLVATIGVAQLAQAVTRALPDYRTGSLQTAFPTPISSEWDLGSGVTMRGGQLLVLIVVPLVALALWWLLGHTTFGENVRAASANADLARLTGVSPKLLSTAIWTIAGVLSSIGVILTATVTSSQEIVAIGPNTLLLGMAAALIGRMVSFPRAVIGAVVISLVNQFLTFNFTDQTGLIQFVVFLAVLVLVARISRETETTGESFQFAPRVRAVPERLREIWWVRHLGKFVALAALTIAIALPFVLTKPSQHVSYATILTFAIAAVSITVLTGWGGQLSLGQMAFAGLGALTASRLSQGLSVDIGWRGTRVLQGALVPAPFWLSVLLGAVVACLAAGLVGIGALRVKGLMLAISTIAFAIASTAYIFRRPILGGSNTIATLERAPIGPFDITFNKGQRPYYFLVLIVLCVVLVVVGHLRRSGIGRAIIGVRENEQNAAAFTVSAARAKFTAFALGGFVAGLAGALVGGLAGTFGFADDGPYFKVADSLMLVSIAVIGGLGTLSGAVIGAVWVVGLPAFWPDNQIVPLLTSSIGLLIILLYFPGGLTQIGYYTRDQLLARVAERLPPPAKESVAPPAMLSMATRVPAATNANGDVLATRALTVRFGGLNAVDAVDFRLQPGEVVGLIGTNGAGKSTLLNAIGGYVRAEGHVELLGDDVSGLAPHTRARRGLGRTFQAATLFPELTVRETVELALEARRRTSFWATTLFLPNAIRLERQRRVESSELIDFLGLGRYADRCIAELSTGTRRIVELASVLAVGPRVLCLDEPTAGVAQREAEAFGPLIKRIQAELGASLVIVEHDLPMILSISDRVYCMESGKVIAEGTPSEIRDDAQVVASYLGTDTRAIHRSGTAVPAD